MLLPIKFKMMTEFGILEDRGVETASHAGHCLINLVFYAHVHLTSH